jgi:hypothetical protein
MSAGVFEPKSTFSGRLTPTILLSIAAALALITFYKEWAFAHDDEFISLRYAWNWIHHGELAWNPGERVEGYTNFLHLTLTTFLMYLGLGAFASARIVNAFGLVLLLTGVQRSSRILFPATSDAPYQVLSFVLLLSAAPVVLWTLGGLEPVLAAGFEAWAIAMTLPAFAGKGMSLKQAALAGFLFSLACLTRPDAIVIVGVTCLALLAFVDLPAARRLAIVCGFLIGLTPPLAAHEIWSYSYYGDLLPNTAYAKAGLPLILRLKSGFPYLLGCCLSNPGIVTGMILAVYGLAGKTLTPASKYLFACLFCFTLYVCDVGGDHMPGGRFFVPVISVIVLLTPLLIREIRPVRPQLVLLTAIAALVANVAFPRYDVDPAAKVGARVGDYIHERWPDNALIALHTAGSTPFYAPEMRFIDMLGLNDHVIARRDPIPLLTANQLWPGHARGDGAYVLSRKPDFIILGPAEGVKLSSPWFLSDVELARSAEFRTCYQLETARLPKLDAASSREMVFTYYRRICA